MKLNIQLLDESARQPFYATDNAAGFDLVCLEDKVLRAGDRALIKTGLAMEIPAECVGLICPRSGLALKYGLTVLNAPGVIDADYRGEIGVVLINLGRLDVQLTPGDRIAQMVIVPYAAITTFNAVQTLSQSNRGTGGFGSTGD